MTKAIVYYGTLGGLLLTFYVTLLDVSKIIYTSEWGTYLGYLAILILPAVLFFAIRRHLEQNNTLLFKQAAAICMLISFCTATVYSVYSFIDIHFFDARHLKNLFAFTERELLNAGKSAEEVATKLSRMKAHYYSYQSYLGTYIWYGAFGLIYTVLFYYLYRLNLIKPKS